MSISTTQYTVATSHGSLAVEEQGKGGTPVLLIHGNSSCRGVFQHQLHGQLAENYRFIAFDLPGHGQSSDAPDPARTYTRPGLAEAAVELLEKLRITQVVVFGWSLGGHIGIEMMHLFPGLLGLMITGAPRVSRNIIAEGFHVPPAMGAAGKSVLSIAEIEAFVQAIFGDSAQPILCDAVTRADPRFRKTLFEAARTGAGFDQRLVVESGPALFAVVMVARITSSTSITSTPSHTPIYGKENVIVSEDSGTRRYGKGRVPSTRFSDDSFAIRRFVMAYRFVAI